MIYCHLSTKVNPNYADKVFVSSEGSVLRNRKEKEHNMNTTKAELKLIVAEAASISSIVCVLAWIGNYIATVASL